jgi:L-methionine (R)-S-oxide reductase
MPVSETMSETITKIVKTAPTAEEGARLALDAILEETSTTSGTVHVIPPGGQLLELLAAKDIPPVVMDKIRVIPVGKGMGGVAVEKRQPVTTCNLQTDDAGGIIRQGARATGAQGAVAIPMMIDGQAIGCLGVATREPRDFTRAEIDALLEVGGILARALRAR